MKGRMQCSSESGLAETVSEACSGFGATVIMTTPLMHSQILPTHPGGTTGERKLQLVM